MKNLKYLKLLLNFKYKKPEYGKNLPNLTIKRLDEINSYYKQFIGFDILEECRISELKAKDKHEKAIEMFNKSRNNLGEVQKLIKSLENERVNIDRLKDSDMFYRLLGREKELRDLEDEVSKESKQREELKIQTFNKYSTCVRETQAQQYKIDKSLKYWGIILTTFSAILLTVISQLISYHKGNVNDEKFEILGKQLNKQIEVGFNSLNGDGVWTKIWNATSSGVGYTISGITSGSKTAYNYTKSGLTWSGNSLVNSGKAVYSWFKPKS